jgi:hypothetical protein
MRMESFKEYMQGYTPVERGGLLYRVTLDHSTTRDRGSGLWIIFVYRGYTYLNTFVLPESQATDAEDAVNKVRLMEDLR